MSSLKRPGAKKRQLSKASICLPRGWLELASLWALQISDTTAKERDCGAFVLHEGVEEGIRLLVEGIEDVLNSSQSVKETSKIMDSHWILLVFSI